VKLKLPGWPGQSSKDESQTCQLLEHGQTTLQCPLCGRKFKPEEATDCAACPSLLRCRLIRCPNCFYEFPKG